MFPCQLNYLMKFIFRLKKGKGKLKIFIKIVSNQSYIRGN